MEVDGSGSDDSGQNQWVILASESILEQDANTENKPTFCQLRHPKTDAGSMYLFTEEDRKIQEVLKFQEEYRSWFIGQTVQQDGSLLVTTPVDPVFLVLPYLIKSEKSGKFMTLDQIVTDEDFPECNRLCSCSGLDELSQVADVRGDDDLKAYRFNKDNTLSWLKVKVEQVVERLEDKRVNVMGGSHAATFIKSSKGSTAGKDEYVRYAHGLIADYLSAGLSSDLKEYMGIKEPVREKPKIEEPPAKKSKKDVAPTEDYSQKTSQNKDTSKGPKLSIAQKKLSQTDKTGMKSISSFFSPKPAKTKK